MLEVADAHAEDWVVDVYLLSRVTQRTFSLGTHGFLYI